MAGNERNLVRPKKFNQNPLRIAAGSPLAIQGAFLEILRERFREGNGLDIIWQENWTLTDILIESAYNEEVEARNKVPALYVYRMQTIPSKQVLGDRAGVNLPDHMEGHGAINTCAMMIECISNDEGESAILADIVQFTLLAGRDVIMREFGFYDISMPSLGQTTPFQRDQTKWSTPVEFQVQFWIRWRQVPIRPLLQQIAQRITQENTDAENHFIDVTLNSLRRGEVPDEPWVEPETQSYSVGDITPTKPEEPVIVPVPEPPLVPIESYFVDQPVVGEIDGSNTVYRTLIPFKRDDSRREALFINGLRMVPGADSDYVVRKSDIAVRGYDVIELAYAPRPGDVVTVDFYAAT